MLFIWRTWTIIDVFMVCNLRILEALLHGLLPFRKKYTSYNETIKNQN